MAVKTYSELVTSLTSRITTNGNNEITGALLNLLFQEILESITLKHIVLDTAARNAIINKYIGMRVYVTSESKMYVLKTFTSLSSSWGEVVFDTYTAAQSVAALATKVDKVAGKGLSTNDFTNPLKSKLDTVEQRANHSGTQAISTVVGLQAIIDTFNVNINGILTDILALEDNVNVSYKNIALIKSALYAVTGGDHTLIVSASDGNKDIVLPDATINNGRVLYIKKSDSTSNIVTLNPFDYQESNSTSTDMQLIEGGFSHILSVPGNAVTIQAKSGRWYIIGSHN